MSFYNRYLDFQNFDFDQYFSSITSGEIKRILGKDRITEMEYLALLAPVAEGFLEELAKKAHHLTIQHFGRTILLYTPMYLSNYCINQCLYCGFNTVNHITRKQLSLEEVEIEAKVISATGLKHILILTGDAPKIATVEYIKECLKILRRYFTSIAIESYAMNTEEYAQLIEAGVDSLTIYQETYDEDLYSTVHLKGPKKDYLFRLDAPERGCKARMRAVNVGALLGLGDWRREGFLTGLHANYLQNYYPDTEISISLPRLRPHGGCLEVGSVVSDKNMVQMMLAYRIFMPRGGITISTRENPQFRDNIIRLGVTKMSAGSTTVVGGHTQEESSGQFTIFDERSVTQMRDTILKLGYQPVFKDWQHI